MLPLFTELLRDFFVRHQIVSRDRVFFGPPDQDFVGSLPSPGLSVNVYLADLRENRKYRTNAPVRQPITNGMVREDPYPAWVDAHYLISVWDQANNANVAALAEQATLRDISGALLAGDPLTPATVYSDPDITQTPALIQAFGVADSNALKRLLGNQLALWPVFFQEPGVPYQVLPPEGFPNLSYFWTAMGQGAVWRAIIYLVATIPVELGQGPTYPVVTTMSTIAGDRISAMKDGLKPHTQHAWYQIGGWVSGPVKQKDGSIVIGAIVGARVFLQLPGDSTTIPARSAVSIQEARTDDTGRYQFLFAGNAHADPMTPDTTPYQVVVRYQGLQADPLPIDLYPDDPMAHSIVMRPV